MCLDIEIKMIARDSRFTDNISDDGFLERSIIGTWIVLRGFIGASGEKDDEV